MANVLTGNVGLNDEAYQRRLRRSLMAGNQDMIRRHAPTAEHPFGREEIIPHHEWADPSTQPPDINQPAIDYEQMERARREMMDQHTNTGVRGRNTHARRGHRITNHEFMSELGHRLEEAHSELFHWTMEHAGNEHVDMWQIIAACAIDQMNHGSVLDLAPDATTDINAELKKLEEDKHGTPVAERRTAKNEHFPF